AVAVAFAVGLVVLIGVAHEISQREAVMRGDEVDARVGPPAALLVEIAAAGETRGQLRYDVVVAAPEAADGVAVLAVPFRPFRRKVADLIPAFAEVPRLGNELDL